MSLILQSLVFRSLQRLQQKRTLQEHVKSVDSNRYYFVHWIVFLCSKLSNKLMQTCDLYLFDIELLPTPEAEPAQAARSSQARPCHCQRLHARSNENTLKVGLKPRWCSQPHQPSLLYSAPVFLQSFCLFVCDTFITFTKTPPLFTHWPFLPFSPMTDSGYSKYL